MIKGLLSAIIVLLLLTILVLPLAAQPEPPIEPIPIDGGLSVLLAAGALFGIKKLMDSKKN